MKKNKNERITDGQRYVLESIERFMNGEATLVCADLNISLLDFNFKDLRALRNTNTFLLILNDMSKNCPIFTAAKSGNIIHLHNFGASLVTKYNDEFFVRKISFSDRRVVMEWARANCEISDTRTSEFHERSAETFNFANFDNVIPWKF